MIGMIGAMDEEVAQLRDCLDGASETIWGSSHFYKGLLEGHPVVLVRCHIGKVSAAAATALLIREFHPEWIVNTGSAGGLRADTQRFGDILIPDTLSHHDVDVTAFGYKLGQLPGQPDTYNADPGLVVAAERAVEELATEGALPAGIRHFRGLLVSGDSFIADPQKVTFLREAFPLAVAVEMEAAAIAQVCRDFGVPFVVTRALSDIAGIESPMSFVEYLPVAAAHSAALVRKLIQAA